MESLNLLLLMLCALSALFFYYQINSRLSQIEGKIKTLGFISYIRSKEAYSNYTAYIDELKLPHETDIEFYLRSIWGIDYMDYVLLEKKIVAQTIRNNHPEVSISKAMDMIAPFYPKIGYTLDDVGEIIMEANRQYCAKENCIPMYPSYKNMTDYEKERTKESILEYINENLRVEDMVSLWIKGLFMTSFGKDDLSFSNAVFQKDDNITNKNRFQMFSNIIDYLKPHIILEGKNV